MRIKIIKYDVLATHILYMHHNTIICNLLTSTAPTTRRFNQQLIPQFSKLGLERTQVIISRLILLSAGHFRLNLLQNDKKAQEREKILVGM